jgi:hypothetical protein
MSNPDGPYLLAALLCQDVSDGPGEMISALGILSYLHFLPQLELGGAVLPLPLKIVVCVVINDERWQGRQKYLVVRANAPSRYVLRAWRSRAVFHGTPPRAWWILGVQRGLQLTVEEDGVYWFDVLLDRVLLTRIPLEVAVGTVRR